MNLFLLKIQIENNNVFFFFFFFFFFFGGGGGGGEGGRLEYVNFLYYESKFKIKPKIIYFGRGRGGGRGVDLVNYFTKNPNLKKEFFLFVKIKEKKNFFFFGGGGRGGGGGGVGVAGDCGRLE